MIQKKTAQKADTEPPGAARPRVRDRIFDVACDLFYRQGIRAVGVDAIACEAGTNKMSFYRSFPSKDELVAEYLRDQEAHFWQWWDDTIAPHNGDPRRQIEALFEGLVNKSCTTDSYGCALGNAAVEIREDEHPGRDVIRAYKARIRERLRELARDLGVQDPDVLGDALLLLIEGSHLTRIAFCAEDGPFRNVSRAAGLLIDAAVASSTRT